MSNYTPLGLKSFIRDRLQHCKEEDYKQYVNDVTVRRWGSRDYQLGCESAKGCMVIRVSGMCFTLSGFRDCCGIMVMSELQGVTIRQTAKVKLLKFIINEIAYDVEVGAILYAATTYQTDTKSVIKALGFRRGSTFTNPRTGNNISMFMKKVNQ